jgi:hypothetical protein
LPTEQQLEKGFSFFQKLPATPPALLESAPADAATPAPAAPQPGQ